MLETGDDPFEATLDRVWLTVAPANKSHTIMARRGFNIRMKIFAELVPGSFPANVQNVE